MPWETHRRRRGHMRGRYQGEMRTFWSTRFRKPPSTRLCDGTSPLSNASATFEQ